MTRNGKWPSYKAVAEEFLIQKIKYRKVTGLLDKTNWETDYGAGGQPVCLQWQWLCLIVLSYCRFLVKTTRMRCLIVRYPDFCSRYLLPDNTRDF
jgi:hypothetical protein